MYLIFHDGNWTWLKFNRKPEPNTLTRMKAALPVRWGRRREAWYAKELLPTESVEEAVGYRALGVVNRGPTKTWGHCLQLWSEEVSSGECG